MTTPTKAAISQIAKDAARELYSEWDEGIFLPDKGATIIQSAIDASLPQWIPVADGPKAKGRYETASFIKDRWIVDISEWDGKNFRGEDEFYEILTVHYYKELPLSPQPEDGK